MCGRPESLLHMPRAGSPGVGLEWGLPFRLVLGIR